MDALRYCLNGGLLLGGDERLPTDPCEYGAGCNQMRCRSCGEIVRSAKGLRLSGAPDPAKLFSVEDWRGLPFIQADASSRLYACKCSHWEATSSHFVENDHDSPSEPDVPWTCVGHAVPTLPVELGELTISAESDWTQLVDRILAGACPRRLERENEGPANWLAWLYNYLRGLPVTDALSSAVAARIDDVDPEVVGRVLLFFQWLPRAAGIEPLIERAERSIGEIAVSHPIPEAFRGSNLWQVLIAFLVRRGQSPLDTRATQLVKKIMLLPLSSLQHTEVGPISSLELERRDLLKKGWKEDNAAWPAMLAHAALRETDVVKRTFQDRSDAFDEESLLFIAENASKIEAAGAGRWQPLLGLLVYRWRKNEELAHLIVIAAVALLRSGQVAAADLRSWLKQKGSATDEWVLPIEAALDS